MEIYFYILLLHLSCTPKHRAEEEESSSTGNSLCLPVISTANDLVRHTRRNDDSGERVDGAQFNQQTATEDFPLHFISHRIASPFLMPFSRLFCGWLRLHHETHSRDITVDVVFSSLL